MTSADFFCLCRCFRGLV